MLGTLVWLKKDIFFLRAVIFTGRTRYAFGFCETEKKIFAKFCFRQS